MRSRLTRGDLPFDHITVDIEWCAESSHHIEDLGAVVHAVHEHVGQRSPARELPRPSFKRDTHHLIIAPVVDDHHGRFLKLVRSFIEQSKQFIDASHRSFTVSAQ